MTKLLLRLALIIGAMISFPNLFADGLQVKDGRYAGGPVVEMRLNPSQLAKIEHHYKPGMSILLTKSQRSQIRKEANLKISPTKIWVFNAAELVNDCTCGSANLGLPFKSGWVDLPVSYLCSDKEAKDREIGD